MYKTSDEATKNWSCPVRIASVYVEHVPDRIYVNASCIGDKCPVWRNKRYSHKYEEMIGYCGLGGKIK